MKIAVASGKGGTGKTTLAVALAQVFTGPVQLLDCDVEEPNAMLFLKPDVLGRMDVNVGVPSLDVDRCAGCGACVNACRFNAIALAGTRPMMFPELCHSCGGCVLACPHSALSETPFKIGELISGARGSIRTWQGSLSIGRAMGPPVIREVKRAADPAIPMILDCPPGTACSMITAVHDAEFVILVTEPTPFGLHDLILAVETVRLLRRPFAVVINRSDAGDDRVVRWCEEQQIRILLQIPESRAVAEAISAGKTILDAEPGLRSQFEEVLRGLL
jgi:MinD superfamily P-loop ATPase